MSTYEYRTGLPEGGFKRDVKYRNPEHFDGISEKDATAVFVEPGFESVIEAYKRVGIEAVLIGSEQKPSPVVNDERAASDLSDEELLAKYENKFGRKPGNMKRDTIIAALEEE